MPRPPVLPEDPDALEARACDGLDPAAAAYFRRGAGGDVTRDANRRAWTDLPVRPHVLRDVTTITTTTTVAGTDLPEPVLVAPMALQRLAHPDGELATVAGAAARGTPVVISMAATTAVESLAPLGPVWMQLYVLRDRGRTRALAARAKAAGCRALVVSVDGAAVPIGARRAVDSLALPGTIAFPNLTLDGEPPVTDLAAVTREYDASVTPADVATLAESVGLPLVVKGVLRADDARRCVDAGAHAVVVSNHGGRTHDGAIASARALPAVAAAVEDRAAVLVDGGIRRGLDVVRARALGARAVLVGRPVVWGLALGGAAGVTAVLDQLGDELRRALAWCGTADIDAVGRDLLDEDLS